MKITSNCVIIFFLAERLPQVTMPNITQKQTLFFSLKNVVVCEY